MASPFTSIPVDQDESLVSVGLFQATTRWILIGIEAQEHLSTEELMLRPGASDVRCYDLDQPEAGWRTLDIPLQKHEEILTFKLDEASNVLAYLTWFDEPERPEIKMQLHLCAFDTLAPRCTVPPFSIPWIVEPCHEEAPNAFIDICGDLVGVFVHELISQSHLRVYSVQTGRQMFYHTCGRADKGSTFAFASERTIAVANRATYTIDLIPISTSESSDHIHRLEVLASILPQGESLGSSSLSSSDIAVFKFCYENTQTFLAIRRSILVHFSFENPPSFPDLSADQLVDGIVSIPWSVWAADAHVFKTNILQLDNLMVNETCISMKTGLGDDQNRFEVYDLQDEKTSLGQIDLECQDILYQTRERRILGLRSFEHGEGDRTLESIDIFLLP